MMIPKVWIVSTFRDGWGKKILPRGLQWDLLGDSYMAYYAQPDFNTCSTNIKNNTINNQVEDDSKIDMQQPVVSSDKIDNNNDEDYISIQQRLQLQRGILEAHNRWCFAKHLPFRRIEDIENITHKGPYMYVQWKEEQKHVENETRFQDIPNMLIKICEQQQQDNERTEVWINGEYITDLNQNNLNKILHVLSHEITSPKLCIKQSDGLIRIERYYRGMIRHEQVFEHVMDNLIAMEDAEIIDEDTIIGTATLDDWIMGGNLTSRLWVQRQDNGNILFLRPLYDDNIESSDRRYELIKGKHDDKILKVQKELHRIRYIAMSLPEPYTETEVIDLATMKSELLSRSTSPMSSDDDDDSIIRIKENHKQNNRRKERYGF